MYEETVLETACRIIHEIHPAILSGKLVDPVTGNYKGQAGETRIRWATSFKLPVSATMMIDFSFLKEHPFDESFGVGAKYGSGEETDLVLAALRERKLVYYSDQYIVRHRVDNGQDVDLDRVRSYSYGRGALLRKTVKYYSAFWGLYLFLRSYVFNVLSGALNCFYREKRIIKFEKARAIRNGFMHYSG